jgi:hypothetical protein
MLRTAICLATAVPCLADVLNVRGPSSDYSQISTAVDAAAEGDVIRIWPGNYKGFTIDDKSLTLVRAKDSGNILVKGTCRIENLSAGRSAVLTGVSADGVEDYGLLVSNCAGSVRVREGIFQGADDNTGTWNEAYSGIRVKDSADVELVFCTAYAGGLLYWGYGYGVSGLKATSSNLSAFSSSFHGSSGMTEYDPGASGGDGGHGIETYGSGRAFLSGCTLVGGHGSDADVDEDFWGGGHGSGGNGGWGYYGSMPASFQDMTFQPGEGGSSPNSSYDGADGEDASGGDDLPGKKRILRTSGRVSDDGSIAVRFDGAPGDRVFLLTSTGPGYRFDPVRGPFLVDVPPGPMSQAWRYMGQIGPSGTLLVSTAAPDLPVLGHATLHFQGSFMKGKNYFGSSSWSVVLDAAW